MWVCEADVDLALLTLQELRRFNDQEVLIITDGAVSKKQDLLKYGNVVEVDAPKTFSGLITYLQTRFKQCLNTSYDLFIKLDPDSEIHREIVPLQQDWFGHTYQIGSNVGVLGGANGMSREVMEAIAIPSYPNINCSYIDGDSQELPCGDWVITTYLNQVGFYPVKWEGVEMRTKYYSTFLSDDYVITHVRLEKRIRPHRYCRIVLKNKDLLSLIEPQLQTLNHPVRIVEYERAPLTCLTISNQGDALVMNEVLGNIHQSSLEDIWFSPECIELRKEAMKQRIK